MQVMREREREREELRRERDRAEKLRRERDRAEKRAEKYEAVLKKHHMTTDTHTSTMKPGKWIEILPKRDRDKEELRHLAIGENAILSLGQDLPFTVRRALFNQYVLRKNVHSFMHAWAWLVDLRTQHIDWNVYEQWLDNFHW